MTRGGSWLLGLLLRLYPEGFRRRFGPGMTHALEQEHRAAAERGWLALCRFWGSTTWNAVGGGVQERLQGRGVGGWRGAEFVTGVKRNQGGGEMMGQTIRDFGLALRRLIKRPGFALAGVTTLGLGLGAATAIFSVLHTVILRPLAYEDPHELVWIGHASDQSTLGVPSGGYIEYRDRSRTIGQIAVYTESTATLQIGDEPRQLGVIRTTPNLFALLGVQAARGRTLTEDDIIEGADPVAVISHDFWQRAFGGDPDVIGRPVVEGSNTQVVGVMPEGFDFVRPPATVVFGSAFTTPDLYFPTRIRETNARFGNFMYQGIGRLTPGSSAHDAHAELHVLMREAADRYSATGNGHSRASLDEGRYVPIVAVLKDAVVGDIGRVLWIVMGTVSLVLLIAAANVTNLFVLRAESLRTELAVRTALGATRRSLAGRFMAEGLTLSLLGAVAALAVASFGTRAVLSLAPSDLPRSGDLGIDLNVLAFTFGVSLLAGALFGLVPVFRSRGYDVAVSMGGDRLATEGTHRRRGRDMLVVGQVAFALILLVGSGLLLRTFVGLQDVDSGFDAPNVMTFKVALDGNQFDGELSRAQFMVRVMDRVGRLSGVEAAAFSADLPFDGNDRVDAIVTSDDWMLDSGEAARTLRVFSGAGYLTALGADFLAGRDFEAVDFADHPRVAVVNEAFAAERWPGKDPLGQRLAQRFDGLTPEDDVWYTVVGVVEDLRERSLVRPPEPTVYLPTVFLPGSNYAMFVENQTLLVRTAGPPHEVVPAVREAIRALDPTVLVDGVRSFDQLTAGSMQQVTFAMVLVILSAGVALVLGLVGIYGAVAYTVGQRTREFGVRIALGATRLDVRNSVLRQGALIGLVGISVGLVGAVLLTRVLRSLLFGVSALDVPTYAIVSVALLGLVVVAGLVPALRATRVDPIRAIGAE